MIGRRAVALAALVFGCASGPPAIRPVVSVERAALVTRCERVFPRGSWRATHVVEAQLPLGNQASFVGVVAREPMNRATSGVGFRSLLVSQEGLTLFEASCAEGDLRVDRALPPLDNEGFGRGMTGDIRLMLFVPNGRLVAAGASELGESTCRWQDGEQVVDVVLEGAHDAHLRHFQSGKLVREARLVGIDEHGFAEQMWLEASGMPSYSLHLVLLDVELDEPH